MADWIDVFIGLRFSLWPGWVLAVVILYIIQCRWQREQGKDDMLRRLQNYETLASPDNGQQTTQGRQPAKGSLLVAQSLSIPSVPFRLLSFAFRRQTAKHKRSLPRSLWLRQSTSLQVNETTSGATAGELCRNYGFMESRIDGIMELRKGQVGSKLMAHCPKETR